MSVIKRRHTLKTMAEADTENKKENFRLTTEILSILKLRSEILKIDQA